MEVRLRILVPGEPAGTIDLARLEGFAKAFRVATLRSAQAAMNVPSFRHTLGDQPRPEYRLVDLTDGSTTLVLNSVDERPLTREAVTRHLEAVQQHERTGSWPGHVYGGELQAWADVYQSLFRKSSDAEAIVTVDGDTQRITRHDVEALAREPKRPMYREVILIGDLHLIDTAEGRQRYQIGNDDADLVFELGVEPIETIDPFRWKRVRAHALWEVGTRRGRLQEPLALTEEPRGIQVLRELEAPNWVLTLLKQIESYTDLTLNWNDRGSRKVTAGRTEAAQEFLRRVYERFGEQIAQAVPSFIPNSAGNIEFDWELGDRFLNVEFVDGRYEVLATVRDTDLYAGPASQQEVFAWINWLLTGEAPPR
jgi:hypothetical protein